jgi:cell division protein YceG involved in septum cleavage
VGRGLVKLTNIIIMEGTNTNTILIVIVILIIAIFGGYWYTHRSVSTDENEKKPALQINLGSDTSNTPVK